MLLYCYYITIDASGATSLSQGSTTHAKVQQDTQTIDSKPYVYKPYYQY